MDTSIVTPLISLAISVGTLVFTGTALRQKAAQETLVAVQDRLTVAESALEECKKDRDELRLQMIEVKQDIVLRARQNRKKIELP